FPFPERSGKRVQQRAAEENCGGTEESSSRGIHLLTVFGRIFGNERGTMRAPSFTAIILSMGTLVNFSTKPLGQVISRESILVRLPRPKKIRGSLADM